MRGQGVSVVSACAVVACLALALVWGASPAAAIDFDKFQNCKDCLAAGFGWCPNMRRCGGFANNRCRGDVTDTRRPPAEEKAFMEKIEGARGGGGRQAPPPPPPPPPRQQQQQQQRQQQQPQRGGGGEANPLAPGKLVDFSFGIEKHLTGHHLKTQLIVFTNGVYDDETKALKKAAKKLRSRALVVRIVARDFRQVTERFGFKGNKLKLPQLAIADFSRGAGLEVYRDTDPFRMRRAVDLSVGSRAGAAKVLAFMEAFDKGDLPLYVRSQPLPATQPFYFPPYANGQVLTAVGDNLPAAVMDKRKAVLLFAWMPGCAHCKAFTETFAALAPAFAMRVQFVSMDGTQNDVDHPKVTFGGGYPSIWFFGRYDKSAPVQHNARDRGKKAFTAWLNEQIAKDEATGKAQKQQQKRAAADDDDDTVFADDAEDDDDDDDEEEYQRPTPSAPAPTPTPAPAKAQPKAEPVKAQPPKATPSPTPTPKKAAEPVKPDDVLWGVNDEFVI